MRSFRRPTKTTQKKSFTNYRKLAKTAKQVLRPQKNKIRISTRLRIISLVTFFRILFTRKFLQISLQINKCSRILRSI